MQDDKIFLFRTWGSAVNFLKCFLCEHKSHLLLGPHAVMQHRHWISFSLTDQRAVVRLNVQNKTYRLQRQKQHVKLYCCWNKN